MRCLCLRSWTLHCLIAVTLLSLSAAQITQQQFEASFKLYPATGPGGCDRDAPNGTPMLNYVLQSIDDAWTMASTAIEEMQLYFSGYSGRRTRPLLFLFFGVKFTEDYNFEPDGTSENTYNYVLTVFQNIGKLQTAPNPNGFMQLPRFRCLEDYAAYYEHLPGDDGKENMTAELAAVHYDKKMPNGQYYPGLMFVFSPEGFYPPQWTNPTGGGCGSIDNEYTMQAFTLTGGNTATQPLYGITLCPGCFELPTTKSLGTPAEDGGVGELNRFYDSGGSKILHEMAHLVTQNTISDQPAAYPPDGTNFDNRDWSQWVLNDNYVSYGYTPSVYLSLAKPNLAQLNADNYLFLALCLAYEELDCVGTFQNDIKRRRSLPFKVSSRTIEKIRSGELDLNDM